MTSASTLHPPFPHRPKLKSNFLPPRFRVRCPNPSFRMFASSSSSSDWEREEMRWIREEQRWIREEQRWIREESRWRSERKLLVEEIEKLKLKIESLNRGKTLEAEIEIGERMVIPEKAQVKELIFEEKETERLVFEDTVKESQDFQDTVRESQDFEDDVNAKELEVEIMEKKKRRVLRMGVEGDDVKELQECLLKLGFYSGEEDMEYSYFSSGTERAVKTWQSSVGKAEDGIMTLELLENLLDGKAKFTNKGGDSASTTVKEVMNGAPPRASVSKIAEIKEERIIKKSSDDTFEESSHKVFLLGENRWEEPSRLKERDSKISSRSKIPTSVMCLTCRGEGRLMCTECDGSGEPNIEPQFMEWVDEGTKCPYCEGAGFTNCDVCEGNGAVNQI